MSYFERSFLSLLTLHEKGEADGVYDKNGRLVLFFFSVMGTGQNVSIKLANVYVYACL